MYFVNLFYFISDLKPEPNFTSTPTKVSSTTELSPKIEFKPFTFKPKTISKCNLKPLELRSNLNRLSLDRNENGEDKDRTPVNDVPFTHKLDRDKTPVSHILFHKTFNPIIFFYILGVRKLNFDKLLQVRKSATTELSHFYLLHVVTFC